MDYSSIYMLNSGCLRGALHVNPREPIDDDRALLRGECLPSRPLVFEHSMGGKPRDVIATGLATIDLFSDRVVGVLREQCFTGWDTFPVEVYGREGELIGGYQGFAVTGRCGPIDNSRSRRIMAPPATPQGRAVPAWQGYYFDAHTWDGSDFFIPEGTASQLAVKRVRDVLVAAKITNLIFTPVTEFVRLML